MEGNGVFIISTFHEDKIKVGDERFPARGQDFPNGGFAQLDQAFPATERED